MTDEHEKVLRYLSNCGGTSLANVARLLGISDTDARKVLETLVNHRMVSMSEYGLYVVDTHWWSRLRQFRENQAYEALQ